MDQTGKRKDWYRKRSNLLRRKTLKADPRQFAYSRLEDSAVAS